MDHRCSCTKIPSDGESIIMLQLQFHEYLQVSALSNFPLKEAACFALTTFCIVVVSSK